MSVGYDSQYDTSGICGECFLPFADSKHRLAPGMSSYAWPSHEFVRLRGGERASDHDPVEETRVVPIRTPIERVYDEQAESVVAPTLEDEVWIAAADAARVIPMRGEKHDREQEVLAILSKMDRPIPGDTICAILGLPETSASRTTIYGVLSRLERRKRIESVRCRVVGRKRMNCYRIIAESGAGAAAGRSMSGFARAVVEETRTQRADVEVPRMRVAKDDPYSHAIEALNTRADELNAELLNVVNAIKILHGLAGRS